MALKIPVPSCSVIDFVTNCLLLNLPTSSKKAVNEVITLWSGSTNVFSSICLTWFWCSISRTSCIIPVISFKALIVHLYPFLLFNGTTIISPIFSLVPPISSLRTNNVLAICTFPTVFFKFVAAIPSKLNNLTSFLPISQLECGSKCVHLITSIPNGVLIKIELNLELISGWINSYWVFLYFNKNPFKYATIFRLSLAHSNSSISFQPFIYDSTSDTNCSNTIENLFSLA